MFGSGFRGSGNTEDQPRIAMSTIGSELICNPKDLKMTIPSLPAGGSTSTPNPIQKPPNAKLNARTTRAKPCLLPVSPSVEAGYRMGRRGESQEVDTH